MISYSLKWKTPRFKISSDVFTLSMVTVEYLNLWWKTHLPSLLHSTPSLVLIGLDVGHLRFSNCRVRAIEA